MINQSGTQVLVEFGEIKAKVGEKMKEYNIVERSKRDAAKQNMEEEKKESEEENKLASGVKETHKKNSSITKKNSDGNTLSVSKVHFYYNFLRTLSYLSTLTNKSTLTKLILQTIPLLFPYQPPRILSSQISKFSRTPSTLCS